jgi:hypothetical protein
MGEVVAGREVNPSWFGGNTHMVGRAIDDSQKQEILERLLEVWKANPFLRLGQLIGNVYHSTDRGGVSLYYQEDFPLVTSLEEAYREVEDDDKTD